MVAMAGYRYGLLQPGQRKTFSFPVPDADELDRVDAWISSALDTDATSHPMLYLGSVSGCEGAQRYLSQLFLTAAVLLQDIRVPLFERAVLETIRQQGDRAEAQVWIPLPEGLPAKIVDDWISLARIAMIRLSRVFGDEREVAYQEFNSQYIESWKSRIPGGQSTIPLLQAAFEQGVAFSHAGSGRYVLGWGAMSHILHRSASSGDSAIGAAVAQNKASAIEMMRIVGIPTPRGVLMKSGQFAPGKIDALRKPWVIKPVDRDRGEGVSLNVESVEQAKSAFDMASALSAAVLVEEQAPGTCHRILVVDQRVIYVVKRNPKTVVGDGVSSIDELVARKNAELRCMLPSKRLPEYCLDEDALSHLARMKMLPTSVPEPGRRVSLRAAQSTRWGGDPEDVTSQLHPENEVIAVKAAQLFRLRCAGIDLISQDIGRPWFENGAVINEVNFSPVIGRTHEYQRRAATAYIRSLFPTQGRIPIEVYLGADMRDSVADRGAYWQSRGMAVKICCDEGAGELPGSAAVLSEQGRAAYKSIAMTRFDPGVQVLLVHLCREESFSWNSLPFPWLTKVSISSSLAPALESLPLWGALQPMVAAMQAAKHD
jgi:cyanophycin synthetase